MDKLKILKELDKYAIDFDWRESIKSLLKKLKYCKEINRRGQK